LAVRCLGGRDVDSAREEVSVDVATTLDHEAADTAIGQITADALHIDVRAGADNNRRTSNLPTQLIGDSAEQ
jgi:hypothetical protein